MGAEVFKRLSNYEKQKRLLELAGKVSDKFSELIIWLIVLIAVVTILFMRR